MKVELTRSQCENLANFIEMELITSIRNDVDVDNIEYLCDMCDAYKKLREAERIAEV